MEDLQRMLYAQDKYALLLIFQAMDAAGKDGTIRAVMTGINPAGVQVFSFKVPTPEGLDHDFLWRTTTRLPERGRIGIFNRSYYEEVLVVRVHPKYLGSQKLPYPIDLEQIWSDRFESIREHEQHLARNGLVILKFWLNVSKEEQRQRFLARIEEPEKMRKFALRLVQECSRAYDILYPMIISRNDGLVNWMPVWFDGRLGTIQDDMAINFSPEMYKEIFAPAMREQAAHTERTVLHWHDGCAHHLDTFLNIDEIDLIQYGHDPNTGPFRGKINDMKAIQSTGRALFISCIDACDAKFFIDNLKPSGLFMIIDTTSDEESKKMEENVNKWVEERKVSISKG